MNLSADITSSSSRGNTKSMERLAKSVTSTGRYAGLIAMSIGVATSSLTPNWIIEHDEAANFFPEFAGRVVYLSDVWLLLGLATWVVGWYVKPPRTLRLGPSYLFVPLAILVALTALSAVWASDGTTAAFAAERRLLLFGLYVVLVNEVRRATVPVVGAMLVIALLHAAVGLVQVVEGGAAGLMALGEIGPDHPHYDLVGWGGAYGLAFNPNPLGLFLAFVSTSAYGLYLLGDFSWRSRALMLVPYGITFIALVGTLSRAALVGCCIGLVAVTLLHWLWNRGSRGATAVRATTAAVLTVALFLGYPYLISAAPNGEGSGGAESPTSLEGPTGETGPAGGTPLEQSAPETPLEWFASAPLGQFSAESVDARATFSGSEFRLGLPVIREHLWLGVGASNFPQVLAGRFETNVFTPIHNVSLLLLAELGVLGGAAWLLIMSAPLIWIYSRRHAVGADMLELLWLGPLLLLFFVGLLEFTPWATQDGRVLMMAALGLWAGGVSQASPE